MREKSVRLKTWEVQATLANHKSAILQVLKPHDAKKAKFCEYTQGSGLWVEDGYIKDYSVSPCWMKIGDYINQYAAYKPGDVLWVRETWKYLENAGENNGYVYRASENGRTRELASTDWAWHPSIHMPREAARLFLRVTDVRLERVQSMAAEDICNMGVVVAPPATYSGERDYIEELQRALKPLWNSAIKPASPYGWDSNPWAYIVTFERCEEPKG